MFGINLFEEKAEHSSEGGLELNTKAKMRALVVGTSENNGHSLNGSVNGSRHITKGSVLRLLCDDGTWSSGFVEQIIRTRFRGDIRSEYQVRLSDGTRAYFLDENFVPPVTTRVVPTFIERLQKIALSCERAERSDNGHLSAAG